MSETPASPTLDLFIHDVAELVARAGDEFHLTAAVAGRLRALLNACAREEEELLPASMMRPDPDRYVMYPLHVAADGGFSIASAVWDVGQTTPIHDHGTWGVIGIYRGVEHEVRYLPPAVLGEQPPTWIGEGDLAPGEVVVCCTSDRDIHKVSCASPEPVVGIHVYGADIGSIERRAYDESTGAIRMFVSHWARPQ